LGYALRTGSATTATFPTPGGELTDLPWTTINTISVQFSEPVNVAGGITVASNSLKLVGGTGSGAAATPTISGFTSSGNVATWTLSAPLGENHWVIGVASTTSSFGGTAVTDANGAGLDGDFVKSTGTLPSGNGSAGGGFNFFFNVLPGDANQALVVSNTSISTISGVLNKAFANAGYNPYADIDASGVVTNADILAASPFLNKTVSGLTTPASPASIVVGLGGADFTALALGVQETGSSSSSSTPAVANVTSTSTSSTGTTSSTSTTSSTPSNDSDDSDTGSAGGSTQNAATDAAVADFDLADLYV
jgi:hypothetical protein